MSRLPPSHLPENMKLRSIDVDGFPMCFSDLLGLFGMFCFGGDLSDIYK